MREYELLHMGYTRELKRRKNEAIELWRQARLIAYNVILPNLQNKTISIQDYLPLPNDPTEKQQKKARNKQIEQDAKWSRQVLDNFRKNNQ